MKKEEVCPTCGRCPTCGNQPVIVRPYPYQPYPYTRPYPYPFTTTPYSGGTTVSPMWQVTQDNYTTC